MIQLYQVGDRVKTNAAYLDDGRGRRRIQAGTIIGGSHTPDCVSVMFDGNRYRCTLNVGYLERE